MPKSANQKLKLYYLHQMLMNETDDDHGLTMPEIQERLSAKGITADRKSIYDDIEALRFLGFDVILNKEGRNSLYHMGSKKFEIAELKLLVDAIQSSKFITEKKSNSLIKKLTEFASIYEATQLKRQVYVQGRIKTMNESIYYIVDEIHNAILNNRKIEFEYLKWNTKKELVPRKEGLYRVSPWALTWDDENYYLIAFEDGIIKHFRVDKMRKINLVDQKREGRDHFDAFDMARYAKMNFGMFGGEEKKVKIAFKDDLVGVFIDRFGKDITIRSSAEKGWSETNVEVAVSDQFFGWIFALGSSVRIVGPEDVVERLTAEIDAMKKLYG